MHCFLCHFDFGCDANSTDFQKEKKQTLFRFGNIVTLMAFVCFVLFVSAEFFEFLFSRSYSEARAGGGMTKILERLVFWLMF